MLNDKRQTKESAFYIILTCYKLVESQKKHVLDNLALLIIGMK